MNKTKNPIRAALLASGLVVATSIPAFNIRRKDWKESTAKAIASRRAELNVKTVIKQK